LPASRANPLPPRADDAHKGRFGHVLAIGGDHGMGGALRLCAEAAARCGAGLVSAITRSAHVAPILAARPEVMVHACESSDDWSRDFVRRATVLAIGPGLGRDAWGRRLMRRALQSGLPVVLDADALWHLPSTELPDSCRTKVLTPHPAEAARLLNCDVAVVQADRFAAARSLSQLYSACVVLKGNGSLVASPAGEVRVVDAGNPGMASGGMGDVLTGVIAALLAQGLSCFEAASHGALAHAVAGDRAAGGGQRGLLASDLLPELRHILNP